MAHISQHERDPIIGTWLAKATLRQLSATTASAGEQSIRAANDAAIESPAGGRVGDAVPGLEVERVEEVAR